MKRTAWLFLVAFLLLSVTLCHTARAERTLNPPGTGAVATRDASATNIPTTYTTGASMLTGLTGKSRLAVINTATTAIAVSTAGTATNCASQADNAVVPASGTAVFENLLINSVVCIRSLGSAISAGNVYLTVW